MRYKYTPPTVERHEVYWEAYCNPGIYDPSPRSNFGSLRLCQELRTWLDANAPGWKFRSDWDHSNSGDSEEGCHLTVANAGQASEFITLANAISDKWIEDDRATMRHFVHIEMEDGGMIEVQRSHQTPDIRNEDIIARHVELRCQPSRALAFRAIRTARSKAEQRSAEESYRIEVELKPEMMLVPGAKIVFIKLPAADAS